MNNTRPSIGQFSGYFNLCDKDYARIKNSYTERLNIARKIPLLSKAEVMLARELLHGCLSGWNEIDDSELVSFLWPDCYFAFDNEDPLDRTLNIWLSTCKHIDLSIAESIRAVVAKELPFWRVVLRLPRGDDADITIYPDIYIVGDEAMQSKQRFEQIKNQWDLAEEADLSGKSSQVRNLIGCTPIAMPDAKLNVFQLAFFQASFGIVDNPSSNATLWLGTSGTIRGAVPHRLRFIRIGEMEYRPSIFSLSGTLGSSGKWHFRKRADACGRALPFPIPSSSYGCNFTLVGEENDTYTDWELIGIVGDR